MLVLPARNQFPIINPENDAFVTEFIYGKVQKVLPPSNENETQVLEVLISSGAEKGKTIQSPVSSMNNFDIYQLGDNVQIYKMTEVSTNAINYETADYYHQDGLQWVFLIFALMAVIVARKKGLTAILSVIISLLLFYYIFLKMVIAGYSPLFSCLLFVFIITILTIPLIHGFNKKSLSAILAILAGYAFSLGISFLFQEIVALGSAPDEAFRTLKIMSATIQISDILIVSLFMGAIGALIDTAISISSAIFEAVKGHAMHTFSQIYKIGIEVGKDVLGSMINTLLFAYLASALPFLILITMSKGGTFEEFINKDFIELELTRTFIGAISLVILIPIAAAASAYFFVKIKE
jgi:uncharacterized membrane protein